MRRLTSIPLTAGLLVGFSFAGSPPAAIAADSSTAAANQNGARWIGRELAAGDDALGSPADWGLTEDAVFALAATGHGRTQIMRTAKRVRSSGTDYIGTRDAASRNWARIAKTALTLQVAGLDVNAFPTSEGARDLVQEVRAAIAADGSFGVADHPFVHSLGMFTLARTRAGVPAESVRWLQGKQCRSKASVNFGAYGASGCADADGDATAMSVQALRAAGVSKSHASVADAARWLVERQQDTGGLPAATGAVNANTTGLAGQALRDLGRTRAAKKAERFLTGLQVTCTSRNGSAFTSKDVGAIAYDQNAWDDAREAGIVATVRGQWLRASTQAALGLGGPRFDQLSAAAAKKSLPSADCSKPAPRISAAAVAKRSRLALKVTPQRSTGRWTLRVKKKTGAAWRSVRTVRTKGGSRTTTVDLPKGTYRVTVLATNGYPSATSRVVTLVR